MAAIERRCIKCDFIIINNDAFQPFTCPKCGGPFAVSIDEYPEPQDYDDTPEDYED